MPTRLDPRRLLARRFDPISHAYTPRDTQLYALGIGFGADPDGHEVSLRTTAVDRNAVVLDNARIEQR